MLIEATNQPVRYRYRDGRELLFRPGSPIEIPFAEAKRLLEKAEGKVRLVGAAKPDWLREWREVAAISSGLTAEDVRLPLVMSALGVCDAAFEAGNWSAFQEARTGVVRAMKMGFQPPGAKNH